MALNVPILWDNALNYNTAWDITTGLMFASSNNLKYEEATVEDQIVLTLNMMPTTYANEITLLDTSKSCVSLM